MFGQKDIFRTVDTNYITEIVCIICDVIYQVNI